MRVFADAFFYIAFFNQRDFHHLKVRKYTRDYDGIIVTTQWVWAEVADSVAHSNIRTSVREQYLLLSEDPNHRIIEASPRQSARGLDLYHARPDKEWSLTDCISFNVMREEGLQEALTGDHHFAQAGFVPLLAL